MANSWVRMGMVMLAVASAAGPVLAQADVSSKKNLVAKPARSATEIKTDLSATQIELRSVMKSPKDLFDPEKRVEMAGKVVPPLRKTLNLLNELAGVDKDFAEKFPQIKKQIEPTLAILHEQQTLDELEAGAKSKDVNEAAYAKGTLLLVGFVDTKKNPAGQNKVIDELGQLAQSHPNNEDLVTTLMIARMAGVTAGPDQAARVDNAFMNLKSPAARQMQEMMVAEKRQKERENKPLNFSGKTMDGKQFDLSSLKGKVVLVDFWATWCGPCVEEMPRLQEIYKKYHGQGLEIVGVSSDASVDDLKDFLKTNVGVVWLQLYEEPVSGMHPLAKQFDILSIPTMFLVDRKGILRTVEARAKMEELIPTLLAEK